MVHVHLSLTDNVWPFQLVLLSLNLTFSLQYNLEGFMPYPLLTIFSEIESF